MIVGEHDCLRTGPHAELVEQVREVVAYGLVADREPLRDLRVRQALAEQTQDLPLARRELRESRLVGRAGLATPVNSPTASWKRCHDGSCSSRMWLRDSSSTKAASGISVAMRRPSEIGATASPRPWSTRVGTLTRDSKGATSTMPRDSSSAAAIAGEALLRHRSLYHSICSWVPSGTKRVVNACTKAGWSRPQPSRISSMRARYSRSSSGLPRAAQPCA